MRNLRHHFVLIASIAVATFGCKDKERAAAASSGTPASGSAMGRATASARSSLTPYRPLLDEAVRAELDVNGLLIDFGTAAQHKYTRGGWRSGWGRAGQVGDTTFVPLVSRRGFLDLVAPHTPPTEVVVRGRGNGDRSLTVFAGDVELGTVKLGRAWSVARVPIAAGAFPRTERVRLELRADGGEGTRAELDWLWLAGAGAAPEPSITSRVLPLAVANKAHRTLAAPSPRTYSFFLQPADKAKLVVDLGAVDHARFVVTATADGAEPVELLREAVDKTWVERAISLAQFQGKAIRLDLTTEDQRGGAGWGEPELMIEPPPFGAPPPGAKPKNVILLVMDTARADSFGPFGGAERVAMTPSYDAFAARSTVFTSAYDNENWTKPSVATTLTGLYPSTHATKKDESKLSSDVELISEHLRRAGASTAAFVANGYVSDKFGFEQGWDTFTNYIRENKASEAEHVFRDALTWHASHVEKAPDKPFFLYLQTIDPHVTYRVDREFWAPYFEGTYDGPLGSSIDAEDQVALSKGKLEATDRDRAWLRALYWGEISYHDAELGGFLAELEKRGALADTMIVITNDHGEELGERGRYGHGHQVFEEMIRAPLLVHYPPLFPAGTVPDIVEHVDLAPTILDALGRDPLANADGISFLDLVKGKPGMQPRYAMTEFLDGRRVLRVGTWKLIARSDGSGTLFDLAADPREEHEIAGAPITRRLCEVHLGEALAVPDKATRLQGLGGRRQYQAGAAHIDPQMRRQLEALGYFGGTTKDAADD